METFKCPPNHCLVCRMVAPSCLCNTCKNDTEDGACCKNHGHAKCLVESCVDYDYDPATKVEEPKNDAYDF